MVAQILTGVSQLQLNSFAHTPTRPTVVPPDILTWIKPLITLVKENPGATLEGLALLNVKKQAMAVEKYLDTLGVIAPGGSYLVTSGTSNDDTGIIR